ncbi:MAG: hypothetical protein AAGJ82_06220 [Bacteroidota bacterium]
MPESRKEQLPADIQTGDLSVSFDPATANTMALDSGQVEENSTEVLAAGAYYVKVRNTSLVTITVNGDDLNPNNEFILESRTNPVNNRHDFCPAVTIVTPARGSANYVTYRPST